MIRGGVTASGSRASWDGYRTRSGMSIPTRSSTPITTTRTTEAVDGQPAMRTRLKSGAVRPLAALVALALGTGNALAAGAQAPERATERTSEAVRERCVAARDGLGSRLPARGDTSALSQVRWLGHCPESAGAVLSQLWLSDPQDPELIGALMTSSSEIRDDRILSAVIRAATETTRSAADRKAALIVMMSYADPSVRGSVIRSGTGPLDYPVVLVDVGHPYQSDAAGFSPANARAAIVQTLSRLALQERPGELRTMARWFRDRVGSK
jgi:hypothetical protein